MALTDLVDVLVAEPGGEALRESHNKGVLELRVDGRQRPARLESFSLPRPMRWSASLVKTP